MNPVATKYHSAQIEMQLECSGDVLAVGHLGPNYLILREASVLSSREALLRVVVDGEEERYPVRLTADLSRLADRFDFESVG